MTNRRRGEITANLAGRPRPLCLTLGALASLEEAFQEENLNNLITRFSSGNLSSKDIARILEAGLKGAGESICLDEIESFGRDETVTHLASVVAELLTITFGGKKPAITPPSPCSLKAKPQTPEASPRPSRGSK